MKLSENILTRKGERPWVERIRRVMKNTCKGCYAAITGSHPLQGESYGCELGYKTDGKGRPMEECPKPSSWRQLERETGVHRRKMKMERMLFFEETVTYHHSIKMEADSEILLEDMLEDICRSIESGEIEEKEEIQRRISSRGIKPTFIEDRSPDVEITCI